ncbi:glycoside hydrolase family 2 TIM barrel-domain containing protein [Kiritimatiellota bacterium B12222]|nr:glycoside hydrolase family 2 TIM barrel-domain containing protein [Kiritimatiellota bacterium B12222]
MKKILSFILFVPFLLSASAQLIDTPELGDAYRSSISEAYRLENSVRTTYSLNGVWKIAPMDAIVEVPPAEDAFGYVVVPSSWVHTTEFPITGSDHFKPGSWSGNNTWKGKVFSEYPSAWYVREFDSPVVPAGKEVFLKLDRVTIGGTVILNGKALGRLTERDDVRWNVTELLLPEGESNLLQVRVDALLSKNVKAYLGGDQTVMQKVNARLRGITGDVWLQIESVGPQLNDLFITSSTRQNTITFEAALDGQVEAGTTVDFVVDVFDDATGEKAKQFKKTKIVVTPETKILSMTHRWEGAEIWDLDHPYLYTAVATLQSDDEILDETFPEIFGFREVWIEGRDIIMNGKPLHLFSYHSHPHDTFVNAARKVAESEMNDMTAVGFNSIQLGSEGTFMDGRSAQYYHDVLDLADRKGIPVIMPIFPVYAYGWENPAQQALWTEHMQALVKRYRNHPSMIIYGLNFNYLGYGWDMNPHTWASGYQPPDTVNALGLKRAEAADSVERLKGVDDSRLIYNHASGNYGDFITSNFYPCWPPIQELSDAISGWAKTGTKPLIFVELSLPVYMLDLMRARKGGYMDVLDSEVFEAEYLSETLGPDAYTLQSESYLQMIADNATRESKAGTDKYTLNQPYTWNRAMQLHEPLAAGMHALRPPLLAAWRTYGLTGFSPNNRRFMEYYGRQYEPWKGPVVSFSYEDLTAPGPKPFTHHNPQNREITSVGTMTANYLSPVLVYFGGAAAEGFSAKDHAWFSDEVIRKQVVVVNDARQDLRAVLEWRLVDRVSGDLVVKGEMDLAAAAGTSAFFDLNIQAPDVKERSAYLLEADWKGPLTDKVFIESFALEVFPRTKLAAVDFQQRIGLFDPVGQTKKLFDELGLSYELIDGAQPLPDTQLFVVGRDVLTVSTHIPPAILTQVIEEGKTLIVFEQTTLEDFGLRVHARGERTVFPVGGSNPILEGLSAEDLRDWRGAISLDEAYPKDLKITPGSYPKEFWKWGNKGIVVSYMIEKPVLGSFLSLAECGFDLQYTPLIELREGKGTVILSQLELSERVGMDPVATQVFNNLMDYASTLQARTVKDVLLSGTLAEDPLLQSAVQHEGEGPVDIILHSGPLSPEQAEQFSSMTEKGGTVVLMGAEAMATSGLPLGETETYYRAVPVEHVPLNQGISVADTFIKDQRQDAFPVADAELMPLTHPPMLSVRKAGEGSYVLLTIDPAEYRDSDITPERSQRIYGKVLRMVSAVTTNLGGEMTPFSQSYLDGFSNVRVTLPDVWKFSTDPDNTGVRKKWFASDFDDSEWQNLAVPGLWENQGVNRPNPNIADSKRPYDGFAWYRCEVTLPEVLTKDGDLYLTLGAVDDMDVTYFNGVRIGKTGAETEGAYAVIRRYRIPAELIQGKTEHTLSVRVFDNVGGGGLTGPDLYIDRGEVDPYPYITAKPIFNPYKLKRW